MGKVSYIEIPPGYDQIFRKPLMPGDRFSNSRIRVKDLFLSRARKKGVTQKSLLVSLSPVWASLTTMEKEAWAAAGVASNLSGFKAFVSDTAARLRASISGFATPNPIYQASVGRMLVQSPATGLTIEQPHPFSYYVYKKVSGTRSQFFPQPVSESFGFPLEISISWKTDLVAAGADPRARFFCTVFSSYQGRDIETVLEIPFGLTDSWQRSTATLSTVVGPVQGYSAYLEIFNARGNLYFDDVSIAHSGINWARDPNCNNVAQSFTKAFSQIPRHWAAVDITDGADFGSFYFNP